MSSKKQENVWLNLGFNIAAPSIILIKGKALCAHFGIAPQGIDAWIFAIALAFPLAYGIYDLAVRRRWNIFSIVGLASVFLTGGIGLLKLSREAMIVKETAVPLVLGVGVLATAFTRRPLAKMLLLNDSVVDVESLERAVEQRNTRADFDSALKAATLLVAASFLVSAVLNFALASYIFRSDPGTEAFNEEVGKMTAMSFPVIVLPTLVIFIFAMYKFFSSVTKYTGLKLEDILLAKEKK